MQGTRSQDYTVLSNVLSSSGEETQIEMRLWIPVFHPLHFHSHLLLTPPGNLTQYFLILPLFFPLYLFPPARLCRTLILLKKKKISLQSRQEIQHEIKTWITASRDKVCSVSLSSYFVFYGTFIPFHSFTFSLHLLHSLIQLFLDSFPFV